MSRALQRTKGPRLAVVEQPAAEFYKDEGGKTNCMSVVVELQDVREIEFPIPLQVRLHYESQDIVEARDQGILNLMDNEYEPPTLQPGSLQLEVRFRIEKVSRRKDGQRFCLRLDADNAKCEEDVSAIEGCFTNPICVLSKRKNHSNGAGVASSGGNAAGGSRTRGRANVGAAELGRVEARLDRRIQSLAKEVSAVTEMLHSQGESLRSLDQAVRALVQLQMDQLHGRAPVAKPPQHERSASGGSGSAPAGYQAAAQAATRASPSVGQGAAGSSFGAATSRSEPAAGSGARGSRPLRRSSRATRGKRQRRADEEDFVVGEEEEEEEEGEEWGTPNGGGHLPVGAARESSADDAPLAKRMRAGQYAAGQYAPPSPADVGASGGGDVSSLHMEAASALRSIGDLNRGDSLVRMQSSDSLGNGLTPGHLKPGTSSDLLRGLSIDFDAMAAGAGR